MRISIEKQKEVVDYAVANYSRLKPSGSSLGLCSVLLHSIVDNTECTYIEYEELRYFIPYFTKKNAKQFGGTKDKSEMPWWWSPDDPRRFEFLLWIQQQY